MALLLWPGFGERFLLDVVEFLPQLLGNLAVQFRVVQGPPQDSDHCGSNDGDAIVDHVSSSRLISSQLMARIPKRRSAALSRRRRLRTGSAQCASGRSVTTYTGRACSVVTTRSPK